jgi:hypothetical protein
VQTGSNRLALDVSLEKNGLLFHVEQCEAGRQGESLFHVEQSTPTRSE